MTYRSAEEALRERTRNLEAEKASLHEAQRAGSGLEGDARALEKQLANAKTLLTRFEQKRALPMLDAVKIASPCSESWDGMNQPSQPDERSSYGGHDGPWGGRSEGPTDAMKGDDKSRFCGKCEKNVYNLSAMTREEAELVMLEREGELCVRLYRRKDGTVLTQDCPVGVQRKRLRLVGALAIGGGLAATLAGFGAYRTLHSTAALPDDTPVAMGAIPPMDPPSTPSQVAPEPPAMGTVAPPAPSPPPKPPVAPKPHAARKP